MEVSLVDYLNVHASGVDIVHTNAVVVRRSLIESIGMFPCADRSCRRAGDGKTWLHLLLAGKRMAWSPHLAAIYYQDTVNRVSEMKLYSIEENCLLSFLKARIEDSGECKEVLAGLRGYYKSRFLSNTLLFARQGRVDKNILMATLRVSVVHPKSIFVVCGWFFPKITKFLLRYI